MRYCPHCHATHLGKGEACPDCHSPLSKTVPEGEGLHFDGLYFYPIYDDGMQYAEYLRFYPDFRVIFVSSTGSPEDVCSWFRIDASDGKGFPYSIGKYALDKGNIIFRATSKNGDVDFQGTVEDPVSSHPSLTLDSKSRINGYEAFDRQFVFFPLP